MPKPQIIVIVYGGLVNDVDWPDELKGLFEVVVQDFDDVDETSEDYREGEDGSGYIESVWRDPE